MAANETQCQALRLSDAQRCENEATNANGLFCQFHAKQVFGLYKGYKRRNAMLDALEENAPPALKNSRTPLSNDTFEIITEEGTLKEIHSYLFEKYVLLGKVIDARKLHHKHFYSQDLDYGHQIYLDKLSSQRHTVLRALNRLEKRTAKVLYQKEQWFTWVRKIQDEEEANGEKEQKKVKQEAALFKRHWKQVEAQLELKRQKEEKKRQDAYLEDAYKERMSMADEEDDEGWDPIEDMVQHNRDRYIDLMKHFLWMTVFEAKETQPPSTGPDIKTRDLAQADEPKPPAKKNKKRSKAKGGAAKLGGTGGGGSSSSDATGNAYMGQERLMAMRMSNEAGTGPDLHEPDKSNIETEEEMRKRLSEGVEKNLDSISGWQLVGTLENPHETFSKTAPMTNDEIEAVVKDIREIKVLLFCRLLLARASMLPAALRATNVLEFLNDADVAESDLRDLCLKVEKPSLQEIRDACADFARGDEVGETAKVEVDDYEDEALEDLLIEDSRYRHLHSHDWLFDTVMKQVMAKSPRKKKKRTKARNSKVTICGRSIWNHASENAMSRDGWLHFSILAKDCDLKHAVQLCRNWAEFTELNHLTLWQYFPASNWVSWGGDRLIRQLQELRLFPYFTDLDAQKHSRRNQVAGRTRGRRQHDFVEARNVIAAHMKRNDPVTQRFIQYLVMRTGEVLVLVRDGKTGRVITAPPARELWTYRKKQGLGRASKSEWENILEIGPEYFDMTDRLREWRFGFDDYYDIFVWDFVPDQAAIGMYNVVVTELRNAWRITHPRDVYRHMKPLLLTLTREKDTMRTRQIKEGEDVESLWQTVSDERNEFKLFDIKGSGITFSGNEDVSKSAYMFYNEANAAEDEVLFPDELDSNDENVPFREIRNGIARVEHGHLGSTMRHIRRGVQALEEGKNPMDTLGLPEEDNIFALPRIWKTGLKQVYKEGLSTEQRKLLKRTGLSFRDRVDAADDMELMERDRAYRFKESLHDGDLEPGNTQRYSQVLDKLIYMLAFPHSGPTDWVWFLAEILDWLKQRADYRDYASDPAAPWPHGFIIQDLVQAFVSMAIFFPESPITALVTRFINSNSCEDLRKTNLFDPKERCKTRPDRRGRTSYKFREKEFWTEWKKVYDQNSYFADVYPMKWSVAIRPIIAHLYRAGIIAPAYIQNDSQVVSGIATANTEPHRPDKLDLFINYEDQYGNFNLEFGPDFMPPSKWPDLLPLVKTFGSKHPTARFALLRLWSAAHYYPFMVGLHNRQNTSFLDSTGRSWEWKFVPKDMPASEFSAHRVTSVRLDLLREQFGGRVTNRGDLILVMGEDSADLMKYCTAVTFALQTKPWLREIDLWKSFVNVDLDFVASLDPFWLD
ncbi:hypothetical protein QQZ08_000471 [Neonectria magnoliae]|uniref:Mfs allantoate n=1 Tax=Neonectria magnoliae TaxID=2732573 RepID=A0ABR1IIJ2_9HYPO